jgi:hypothetical protein
LYLALALLLALLGVTAAWLLFPSRLVEPSFVDAWIDQYDDPRIPPTAWSTQDRKALNEFPWEAINAFNSQEGRHLRQLLSGLRKHPTDRPLVVFLGAVAATKADGTVCMLPSEAAIEEPNSWIPLTEILGYLRACPAPHKLLLLDLMRPVIAPRLGILADDVSVRVQATLEEAIKQDPHLLVLCACAPGQHSLVSEALGHSVFAHYLVEGLKGRADGYGGTRDGRVSVRELALFVQARVDRWSAQAGQARQTPQFLGGAENFLLFMIPEPPAPAFQPPTLAAYPDWLKAKWGLRDAWQKQAWARPTPGLLRRLEEELLRAERRLAAGHELGKVQAALEEQLGKLEKQRAAEQEKWPVARTQSLAREVTHGKVPPNLKAGEILRDYRNLVKLDAQARDAKASDKDKERLATAREAFLKQFAAKPFDLAWLAFEELAREPQPQDRLRFVHELLNDAGQVPAYEEVVLVKRLAEWKIAAKDWPAPAVQQALQLVKKWAQLSAGTEDPRILPWVKSLLAAARSQRQAAEQLLFQPGEAGPDDVVAELSKALNTCNEAVGLIEILARAYRVRDDALVRLPGYAAYAESAPEEERLRWEQAAGKARELVDLLEHQPKEPLAVAAAVRKLGKAAETLRVEMLGPLRAGVESRFNEVMGRRAKATVADWMSMSALLRLSWLEAGDREQLWMAARKAASGLTLRVLEQDREEDAARKQTPPPPAVETATVAERQRRQALLHARISLALLQLSGAADVRTVQEALTRAEREPEAWHELAEQLRLTWSQVAPE